MSVYLLFGIILFNYVVRQLTNFLDFNRWKQKLPAEHWLLGEAIYAKAMVNYIQGQADLAETQSACDILHKAKGETHHLTLKCETLLTKIKDIQP